MISSEKAKQPLCAVAFFIFLLAQLLGLPAAGLPNPALSLDEIVARINRNFEIKASELKGRLVITTTAGERRTFSIRVYTEKSRKLVHYLSPPQVQGMSFLFLEDDIYVKFKSTQRIKLLAAHQHKMGISDSDLSYEDLEKNIFNPEYKKELLPEVNEAGRVYYQIALKPPKDSAYSRIVTLVERETFFPIRLEYYLSGNQLEKVMLNEGVEKIGEQYLARALHITNNKTKKKTDYFVDDIKTEVSFPANFFSIQNLNRLNRQSEL